MKSHQAVTILIIIALIIATLVVAFLLFSEPAAAPESLNPSETNENTSEDHRLVVCTADAKQCPDGSYVGRSGPNCEFVCPDGSRSN